MASVLASSFNPLLASLTWGLPEHFARLTQAARSQAIDVLVRVEALLQSAIDGDRVAFGRLSREFGPQLGIHKYAALAECHELLDHIDDRRRPRRVPRSAEGSRIMFRGRDRVIRKVRHGFVLLDGDPVGYAHSMIADAIWQMGPVT